MNISRRALLSKISIMIGGLLASKHGSGASLTPRASEGPFYPTDSMRFTDIDNDLVKIAGVVQESGGEVIHLSGTVTDKNGTPQKGLRVEIWQCDMNGKYLHSGDHQGVTYDKGFQGFGHDITTADGRYQFRTIKPMKYPGRTPHIHVKVVSADKEILTTQFYLKDHPDNSRDGLYRRMTDKQVASVSMAIIERANRLETMVNIVV